jgi:hypothetical protein
MVHAHTVTDTHSLQRVSSLRRGSRVALALPCLADEESTKLQNQLNRLVSECGCSMSAAALTLSVLACGFFDWAHWVNLRAHIFETLGFNLLACVAAAGLGRTAGLLRAKWKLARTIRTVEVRLTSRPERVKTTKPAVPEGGAYAPMPKRL